MTVIANAAQAWGSDESGALGIGYQGTQYASPQPVIAASNIIQIEPRALLQKNGNVMTWGNIRGDGRAGEAGITTVPTRLLGGTPLYLEEEFPGWTQPLGPTGPLLPKIKKVHRGGHVTRMVGNDGHVYSFGLSNKGEQGSGSELGEDIPHGEEAGNWPQYSPGLVLKSGPMQTTDPKASNVLGGIVDISGGKEVGYYLDSTGMVWVSGNPVGWPGANAVYATHDPLFVSSPPPTKAVELAGSRSGYMVRTEDGKVHFYGHGYEGMRGTGVTTEPTSNERAHSEPIFPAGTVIKRIAMGEYACLALDTEGYVWVWGSSLEYQLGLGLPAGTAVYVPTRLPRSAFGGSKIVEIKMNGLARGTGQTGGDVWGARTPLGKLFMCGVNHNPGVPLGSRWEGFGVLGNGKFENALVPQLVPLAGVTNIGVGFNSAFAVQKPATPPGEAPMRYTVSEGRVTVYWRGAVNPYRDATGYEVRLADGSGHAANSKEKGAEPIIVTGPREWSWTSPVMPSGSEYTAKVIALGEEAEPILHPIGGEVRTAVEQSVTVDWTLPPLPQPGWIVEYQHVEPLPSGTENWRWATEVPGTATTATINVFEPKFPTLSGEVRVRITGAYPGAHGTRRLAVVVP